MPKYSYKLYRNQEQEETQKKKYVYPELAKMTTYQLRDICYKEKLVKSVLDPLNREELIRLIMRYRGQKQTALIKKNVDDGLDRMEDFLSKTEMRLQTNKSIHIPTKIVVYDETSVDYFDRYLFKSDDELCESNILLVDEENKVYGIFNLEASPRGKFFLTRSVHIPVRYSPGKRYSFLYFNQKESDLLYSYYHGEINICPKYIYVQKIPIVDFRVSPLNETEIPLVIDFGTSNTTLGIADTHKEFQMVNVLNKAAYMWEESTVIPSVLGIKEINEEGIEYTFGYDAVQMVKENYLDEELPVFYDIKRWINDAEREEKVITVSGTYTWVKRKELLKAYLQYIIALAIQRFKYRFRKIQMLSPVRQRGKFNQIFMNLLEEYEVQCQLDEGVAVLFNSINSLIQKEYEDDYWYKAMIIDCGGGTSDLTSCSFKIRNNRVSYNIDLECSYENGDTNFGGNNLTFRIMQLVKIRLVEELTQHALLKDLTCLELNNFRYVDQNGKELIYQSLDEAYDEAEKTIPTRFGEYESIGAEEYFKVKNNYYYLFELAEGIKKQFFGESSFNNALDNVHNVEIFEIMITEKEKVVKERCRDFVHFDKWKVCIKKGNLFLPMTKTVEILLYLYEIKGLLMSEVYSLMKRFLEKDFKRGELAQYDMIKLTGQSCKSDLFVEALKEFVPGRIIQNTKKQKNPHELKICCLSGALFYFQNKNLGYMNIQHQYKTGALPYEVTAFTHQNQEMVLIRSLQREDKGTGHISRFMDGQQLKLYLKDINGKLLRNYYYEYNKEELQPATYESIYKEYQGAVSQDETDNIIGGESKFFVWVSKEEWGFYVLPVLRENETIFKGKAQFFSFEDDTWEQNFFDGLK